MVYILYGTERPLINEMVKKIIKKHKIDDYNISKFDLDVDFLTDIIDDANTISMFSLKRLIVVENAYIFSSKKNEIEHDLKKLENYFDNINDNTIIIFKLDSEKLDVRRKIVKKAKEVAKIKEFNKLPLKDFIVKELEGYEISDMNLSYLIDKISNNYDIALSETKKLKMLKYDNKEISKDDIDDITTNDIESDIFKFVDYIVTGNKEKAFKQYYKLIKDGEEPIKIIALLANQFKLMYFTRELILMGYNEAQVASKLQVHPYRVKLAKQKGYNYTSKSYENILMKLANLDLNIKKGNIDRFLGLELFLMEV